MKINILSNCMKCLNPCRLLNLIMKIRIFALAVLVAIFLYTPVYANFSYEFESDHLPNLINLSLDVVNGGKFQTPASLPSTWYYWQNDSGTQAQIFSTSSAPTARNVIWLQLFNANPGLGAHISYQEVYWNYAADSWTQAWTGGLKYTNDSSPGVHWTSDSYTGGLVITAPHTEVAPVPIPSAVWLFGAGIAALVAIRRRPALLRRKKVASVYNFTRVIFLAFLILLLSAPPLLAVHENVPEIDPSLASSAITLITGCLLILKSKSKRK